MHPAFMGLLVVAAMVLLAVGFLRMNDRFVDWVHRDRRSDEQKAADAAAYDARLAHPRWDELSILFPGARPSPALLDLYSDQQLLVRENIQVCRNTTEEEISGFRPADRIALEDPWCKHLPEGAFPFASDIFGDLLFVELTPDGRDQPVKHWYHDGGDIEVIAPSLETFLTWCRSA